MDLKFQNHFLHLICMNRFLKYIIIANFYQTKILAMTIRCQ